MIRRGAAGGRLFRRQGSLAIFLCLVMAALVMLSGTWLQIADRRAAEADLSRAMAAQIQTGLAAYDRPLLQQFGLFGFLADSPDPAVFTAALPDQWRIAPITLIPESPLSDRNQFEAQIIRHMKARVPAVYLELLADRLKQIGGSIPQAGTGAGQYAATAAAISTAGAADAASGGIAEIIRKTLSSFAEKQIKGAAESVFGDLLAQLQDDLLQKVQKTYRKYAAELLGVGEDESLTALLGQLPDFLDPASLTALAGQADQLVSFATVPIYEKFCLVEYTLGYFVPQATWQIQSGSPADLLTLDGRSMSGLAQKRPCEVEQILTGLRNPLAAGLVLRLALVSLRSLIHLAALLTDETQMASLRAAAASLVAAIAAVSAGSVVIEPELMTYLLAAGQALAAGFSDSQDLIDGKGVNFWPGKGNVGIRLWYQDYLRLMLLLLPRSILLDRCGRQLSSVMPQTFFTSLRVRAIFGQRTYELAGGYLS